MENKIDVKIKQEVKQMDNSEFTKFKEQISSDLTVKLKKISENEYRVLEKMNG